MRLEPLGRKEVAEAVVTAALTTLVTELVTWAVDRWKRRADDRKQRDDKEV